MSSIIITCPHCSFSKEIDRQQIPAGLKKIKCPKCKEAFELEPDTETISMQEEEMTFLVDETPEETVHDAPQNDEQ